MTIIGEQGQNWELDEFTWFAVGFTYGIFKITLGEKFVAIL